VEVIDLRCVDLGDLLLVGLSKVPAAHSSYSLGMDHGDQNIWGATGVYIHAPISHLDFAANSSMVFRRRDSDDLQNVYVNPITFNEFHASSVEHIGNPKSRFEATRLQGSCMILSPQLVHDRFDSAAPSVLDVHTQFIQFVSCGGRKALVLQVLF